MTRFAFFDLDGTLLPWDTQLLFCNFVLRRRGWRRLLLIPFLLMLPLAAVRLVRSRGMKRVFLGYLWRMPRAELEELAAAFAREVADHHLWPAMRGEIAEQRAAGRTIVLNTASPAFYAQAIARELGFDHCFATRVVVPRRMPLVAAIDGPNNKRAAKLDAMRTADLLPADAANALPDSTAYSDSHADLPLLELATDPVVVRPTARLAAQAVRHGWRRLDPEPAPRHPHLAMLRMLLGLWDSKA